MPDPINGGLLVLRLALAGVMLAHGIKHLMGREKTTSWFASMGWRFAGIQWMTATATEIGVGLLLALGFLTGLAAAGVVGILFTAYWTVHRPAGFFITAFMKEDIDVEGWEYVGFLIAATVALAVMGPGEWSLDDGLDLASRLDGWWGLALAVGGVAGAGGQMAAFWRPASSG